MLSPVNFEVGCLEQPGYWEHHSLCVLSWWPLEWGAAAVGHLGCKELVVTAMKGGFYLSHVTPLAVQNHDGRNTCMKTGLCPSKAFCPTFVLLMLVKRIERQVGQKSLLQKTLNGE